MRGFSIRAVVATAVLLLMAVSPLLAADLTRAIEATCRVTAGNSIGTGCVFSHHAGYVYILTNEHVVGSAREVDCEFWQQGHLSRKIRGVVTSTTTEADAAVIAIPLDSFGGAVPPAVPLATRAMIPGETVISVGCAKGAWATTFIGHIKSDDGEEIQFIPPPANGRSGSAIFSSDGSCIVGLLRARNDTTHQGIASTVGRVVRFLRIGVRRIAQRVASGGCPGGVCPSPGGGSDADRFMLPYRRQQQQPQQVYPTLPQQPQQIYPMPMAPIQRPQSDDLSGIEDRLDGLTASIDLLVEELRGANPPPPVVVAPVPVAPVPVAPVDVKPPTVMGAPVDQIAKTVGDAVTTGVDAEGGFGNKIRSGAANLLMRESEDGAVSDTLIRGLMGSLLGPWGLIAAFGVIWIKNRYFPSLARALDPTKPDSPAMVRQKEGLRTVLTGTAPVIPVPPATPPQAGGVA